MWTLLIFCVSQQINTKWCNSSALNAYPFIIDEKKCIRKCKGTNMCSHVVWDEQRLYCYLFEKCDTFIDDVVNLKTIKIN